MARYTRRPRSWVADDLYDDDKPMIPSLYVSEHWETNTGLLDASGEEIWRTANPMGFGHDEEW